jgi:hypothetical protein
MKVLEVHLYGGLSPWETFYHRNLSGDAGWREFQGGGAALDDFGDVTWNNAAACGSVPSPVTQTQLFDNSDAGHQIFLGPATKPLWSPSIRDRMRVIVQAHDLLPHEAAIPYAMSGFRLGNPKLAGLGSPIQRRALVLESLKPPAMRRSIPFSYVCQPAVISFPADNLQVMTSTGLHPGSSRPIKLRIGAAGDLTALLNRTNMTPTANSLVDQYRAQYRDWLRFAGSGDAIRSKGFAEYDASAETLLRATDLQTVLNSAPLAVRADDECARISGSFANNDNVPGTSLRVAASLLSHPTAPARYVGIVDSGLRTAAGGGGYDTHDTRHVTDTSVNLWNTLNTLAELLNSGSINLNETLVVLTTEFGRTPYRSTSGNPNSSSNGRDHWPDGYVNVLIGGPITQSGVVGRINDADGKATSDVYNPSDMRAAVLLAAGIFPFSENLFRLGDISANLRVPGSETETAKSIRRTILGVPG